MAKFEYIYGNVKYIICTNSMFAAHYANELSVSHPNISLHIIHIKEQLRGLELKYGEFIMLDCFEINLEHLSISAMSEISEFYRFAQTRIRN